ncbi:hypothetical protein SAMN05518866_1336 [Sphingobium sp. YR768]|nr:hypothetical protein SAMN05518866_1336 [Sphingobium sp. YR768]
MASYKIFTVGQMNQVLKRSEGDKFNSVKNETVARMRNTPHGWIATKVDGEEGINVSRLINQVDGAERIAEALGI